MLKQHLQEIKEMRGKRYTIQEIGDKFGVCRERIRQILGGIKSSNLPLHIRRQVKKFWEHKCGDCGHRRKKMEIHHIDGNRKHNDLSNLILLCKPCHLAVERRLVEKGLKKRRKKFHTVSPRIVKLKVKKDIREMTFYPRQCLTCKKHFIACHQNVKPKGWIECPNPQDRKFCSQECYLKSDIFKNHSRKKPNLERHREIIEAYKSGKPLDDMVKELKLQKSNIYKLLKKYGVKQNRRKRD